MTALPPLKAESVTIRYGSHIAVSRLQFEVAWSEIVVLLGPNGAGKSTTLRAVLGLTQPSQGVLSLFGQPPTHKRARAWVGYVPDKTELPPFLRVDQILQLAACFKSKEAGNTHLSFTRGIALCRAFEIPEKQKLGALSKGAQRKLLLTVALMARPRFLVLDEPFDGLDPLSLRVVRDLLLQFKKSGGSVFMSSHALGETEKICDRAFFLQKGEIIRTLAQKDIAQREGSLEDAYTSTLGGHTRLSIPDMGFFEANP